MQTRFYNSLLALIIFIGLIIFVPYYVSFFAFKISDIWLLLCLCLQFAYGINYKITFPCRTFLKNFGLYMGGLAILGTFFQAWHDSTAIDPVYFGEFFRFIRYFLIFKFLENSTVGLNQKDLIKFFYAYTVAGAIVVVLSFFEFYSIAPFHQLIVDFYKIDYTDPEKPFEDNMDQADRLLGIWGNSNTTAIYLTSTLVFPVFSLISQNGNLINKLLFVLFILPAIYVIIVLTASRTAVILSILLFMLAILLAFSKLANFLRFFFIVMISLGLGLFLYNQYSSQIVLTDRVTFLFEGKSSTGDKVSFLEAMGRSDLWKARSGTYKNHAHPFAFLVGMGYTGVYESYSDNGLISSYYNTGLVGLLLRLLLYWIFIRFCFVTPFMNFMKTGKDYPSLIFGTIALVFLLWESSADMIEHIKIGQVFYLFFCATLVFSGDKYRLKM